MRMQRGLTRGASLAAAVTLAALLVAGCDLPPDRPPAEDPRRPTVTIASFDFPESQTLAEIYGQALRGRGYPVDVVSALGSREIVEPAVEQGRVDLVVEYMGTALNFLNDRNRVATADPVATHARLEQSFGPRGVSVLAFATAQDRNGFVVTGDLARTRRLETVSDLAPIASQLVFGGPAECPERPLCLKGLEEAYGLRFARFEPMPSRTVTAVALEAGEIHVGMLETTNGNLAGRDLVQLVDDRRLQPAENVVPVIRREIVDAYGPRLVRALNAVTAELTTVDLIGLNRRVELDGEDPAAVATAWLRLHR
jgi:osmoprotectant transport system substrate-binding protein